MDGNPTIVYTLGCHYTSTVLGPFQQEARSSEATTENASTRREASSGCGARGSSPTRINNFSSSGSVLRRQKKTWSSEDSAKAAYVCLNPNLAGFGGRFTTTCLWQENHRRCWKAAAHSLSRAVRVNSLTVSLSEVTQVTTCSVTSLQTAPSFHLTAVSALLRRTWIRRLKTLSGSDK